MSFNKSSFYQKLNDPENPSDLERDRRNDTSIGIPMTEISPTVSNQITREQLLREAEQQFKEQDEALDDLGHVVTNIKHVAIQMGTELEKQEGDIQDLTDRVDRTNINLNRANRRITLISRARDSCSFIGCIVCLVLVFVAIILVVLYGGAFKEWLS